ncbi:hypothetical protein STAFG_3091 [Streptomyces afghaniensis 772]|uniref:Uncharacterized protein n=1 Tax=Streptomyces afghaniensis 772 TaxID=1283301 RepID=S4MVR2_9ACTN|nr:hypothetical protein [Streptomyces afghaniensis]EPJ39875.1 hypothetical protein STAFG_3091 [Streptomyces afghaniensis 772]
MASKDDLVGNVVAEELRTQAARYGTLRPGRPAARDSRRSLQLSRAAFDSKLAVEVLEKGIENALALMC